jgi:hypothetical protein
MNAFVGNSLPTTSRPARRKPLAVLGTALFVVIALYASRSPLLPVAATTVAGDDKPFAATSRAVAAADAFLGSLDAKEREKATFEFGSPKKPNWSNLPVTIVPRNGVRLGDLTMTQRSLAMTAVAAVVSKGGYQKIVDIMDGDQQLAANQGGGGRGGRAMFGSDQYYLAIFGKPSATQPWMVQFGGHHLGVNVTVIGKHFVLTPTHTGAQPARFQRDGKEVRPLGLEKDTAFTLVNALDEKQRAQAIIGERSRQDLILGPGRDGRKPPEPQGIKGSALTADQQAMLLDLVGAWVKIAEPDWAETRMAEIKDKLGDTCFAWSGPTTKSQAAYFRVQGPSVWIEYAPQGGTDHIHTVVRNPSDDYGAGLIKR